jgi:hypothetical protein
VKEVNIEGVIEGILITQAWGFVIVHGGGTIGIYSVNGELLKRRELPSKGVSWSTFVSFDGFDFVTVACLNGDVCIFEAFFPDRITICHSCVDALFVRYIAENETLMIVRHSGVVEWKHVQKNWAA